MSLSPPPDVPSPLPAAPAAATRVFAERLPVAVAFGEQLARTGQSHGLIGPRELPRLWERHILNCAVISEAMPVQGVQVIDVGSGAGLPGIALAVARPDLEVHLVEPMLRRVDWLTKCIAALRLENVTVHRARAEEVRGRLAATYVTARAVARLNVLLRWCAPLTLPGGCVVAMKGSTADAELIEARPQLTDLGLCEPGIGAIRDVGGSVLDDPTTVIVLTKLAAHSGAPGGVPRRRLNRRPVRRRNS